ncbi:hypothetical protein RRG08_018174 [Elysia crispata]|uniref:Uncharacterized protein n=1 Tax=Elysia crispata TaxID=231223 RepID=A0AAE1DP68_9GAST|nr:hypothetical protein RRG08_018174 [Elysia crispata]
MLSSFVKRTESNEGELDVAAASPGLEQKGMRRENYPKPDPDEVLRYGLGIDNHQGSARGRQPQVWARGTQPPGIGQGQTTPRDRPGADNHQVLARGGQPPGMDQGQTTTSDPGMAGDHIIAALYCRCAAVPWGIAPFMCRLIMYPDIPGADFIA